MQEYYWLTLDLILMAGMFLLVPVKRIKQLLVYGLVGGSGLAIVIFFIFEFLHLWKTVGGINIFTYIPLLPTVAWFFTTVLFANYFPKNDSLLIRVGYVLLFAIGSVIAQYILELLGMWRNIHWNLFYTFLLAAVAHTILSLYLLNTEQYLPE